MGSNKTKKKEPKIEYTKLTKLEHHVYFLIPPLADVISHYKTLVKITV